jgi:hypothetical protein
MEYVERLKIKLSDLYKIKEGIGNNIKETFKRTEYKSRLHDKIICGRSLGRPVKKWHERVIEEATRPNI